MRPSFLSLPFVLTLVLCTYLPVQADNAPLPTLLKKTPGSPSQSSATQEGSIQMVNLLLLDDLSPKSSDLVPETFAAEFDESNFDESNDETGVMSTKEYAENSYLGEHDIEYGYATTYTIGCNPCEPITCWNPCDPCGSYNPCRTQSVNPYFLEGWVSAGVALDPRLSENSSGFPNPYFDRVNQFQLNQLYLTLGRNVNPNKRSFDIGGRVDLLYGTDYIYTSALGLETKTNSVFAPNVQTMDPLLAERRWNSGGDTRLGLNQLDLGLYGLSMPQLYAEFFAPLGQGTTLKVGHFYSMMGYESPMSTENFFYTHTLSMYYGEPTTMTGGVLTQRLSRQFSVLAGLTQGWNVWENPNNKMSYVFGGVWNSCDDRTALALTLHTGKYDVQGENTRTNYSLVMSHYFTQRFGWVIQQDLGIEEAGNSMSINGMEIPVRGEWTSLTNYFFYSFNSRVSAGLRLEWFQDYNHSKIFTAPVYFQDGNDWSRIVGNNYYNLTLGLNWRPTDHLTLRPEIRWDWSDVRVDSSAGTLMSGVFGSNNNRHQDQFTVAIEGVYKF
ncbi:MAG: outer membrane beta-barrel protein [Thermoguttaceae bacterium]